MDNSFSLVKRGFSAAIAAATILWAVGVAAFAVPQTAHAATAGSLVRSPELSTVYFVGHDMARYTFTGEGVYESWFNGFGDVETISGTELADIPLGGNVVYRPGSYWVKIQSVADTFAVSTNGMIHHIETEAVASDYAGDDWNTIIRDVVDTFWIDYTPGVPLSSATAFDGMMYMDGGSYYLAWGGESRMVTADGKAGNYMEDGFFLDGTGIDTSSLTAGADVTGHECALTDASQTDCVDTSLDGGDVTVSLNSGTPAGATLPPGANSVEVLTVDLTAGAEDASINILALTLTGIGATTNIENVYLYEGNSRLTEARSVNASTRQATFGSLNLDIPAGTTRTLTVRIEVASGASAGDVIQFAIDSNDDITTDGGDVMGAPVEGNEFPIAATAGGTVEIDKNGSITDPSLGEKDAKVGQFKIAASGSDSELHEMTLKIDNGADHDTFKLWDGSEWLADGTYIGDKLVSFDLSADPFEITDGNSNIFSVTLDVGGEAGDTIGVYVDNSVDVLAIDQDTGFGMTVDIATNGTYDGATNCDASTDNCSFSTIQGGEVTFAENDSNDDIQVNSQDQTLLAFSLTSAQEITVKDLDIIVHGDDDGDGDAFDNTESGNDDDDTGLINGDDDGSDDSDDDASLKDIKIVDADTGLVIMGPLELDSDAVGGDDADQTIDFTDDFTMVAGETLNLEVRADIDDGVTSGTEFGATIDISGFSAEDINGDALTLATDVVPSSDLAGNNHEALAAALTFSLASTPGDVTAVQDADDEEVQAFSVVGGSAGDVLVSGITLSVYAHDAATGTFQLGDCSSADQCATRDVDVNDFISACHLEDNEGFVLDGPKSPEADGTNIIFDDVDWTVEADESERLSVLCDLGDPTETNDVYFAFDIADLSEDVTAEDSEGLDVDPTTDAPNGGTSPTDVLTVTEAGTLALAVDSSSPSADFVHTNTTDNLLAVFRYTATNEDFVVNLMTVTEEAGEDVTGTANATTYTNNISSVTLEYTDTEGVTQTPSTTMSGNEARFSGLDIDVPVGDPAKVHVYVDVPQTDRAGGDATSNEYLELGVSVDTTNDDQFAADGADSGKSLDDDDVSAVETNDRFVVKETSPTATSNGSSPSGTGFTPGVQEVFRFNIAAGGNEDVIIDELLFDMFSTDNNTTDTEWNHADELVGSDFSFYNMSKDGFSSELDVDGDWSFLDSTGAASTGDVDVEWVLLDLTTSEVIPAGEEHTFVLEFNVHGFDPADNDTLQFTLDSDPILGSSSFLGSSALNEDDVAATDTTLTVSSGTGYSAGDVVCIDTADDGCGDADEKALVTAVATNDLTVVRGYLGTTPDSSDANDTGDDVDRLPTAFYWEDDGDGSTDNTGDNWGAYLIDDLPVTGGNMGF